MDSHMDSVPSDWNENITVNFWGALTIQFKAMMGCGFQFKLLQVQVSGN